MPGNQTYYNLLMIDDSVAEMRLMKEAVKVSGLDAIAEVIECFSTEEGFAVLGQSEEELKQIDAIFLDLNVPNIGGIELLKIIKADGRFSAIPIFILTNSDHREDIMACIQNGADAYFQKPPNFNKFVDFFTAIRQSLEKNQRVSIPFIQQQFSELRKAS